MVAFIAALPALGDALDTHLLPIIDLVMSCMVAWTCSAEGINGVQDSVLPSSAVSRIRAAWEGSVHLKAQESTAGQVSHKLEMLCVRAMKAQS